LNEAEGSLLDDEHLLITLQTSKSTSQDIKEQLETAEETEQQIDTAREVIVLVFHSCRACVSWLCFMVIIIIIIIIIKTEQQIDAATELTSLCFMAIMNNMFHGRLAGVSCS